MDGNHNGSCLCGAVRFKTRGALRGVVYCHCSQCRKQTGHFVAATAAKDADIDIEGMDALTWYGASDVAKRGFCRTCGSLLFWKHSELDSISIMAGSSTGRRAFLNKAIYSLVTRGTIIRSTTRCRSSRRRRRR